MGIRQLLKSDQARPLISWSRTLSELAELGTKGYPRLVRRRLRILNLMALLIFVASFAYAVQNAFLDFSTYAPVILINFGLMVMAVCVPFSHRIHETAGGYLIAVSEFLALFAFAALWGRDAGLQLQLFIGAAAPFFIFGLQRPIQISLVVLVSLALHLVAWFSFPPEGALLPGRPEVIASLYVTAAITTFGLIAALVLYAFRLADDARGEMEELLRNVLPRDVAERLIERPDRRISDGFDDASVLFADLVGFTPISANLGARGTVDLINDIVTRLDGLAEACGAEKIKTVGDGYMAVAGVPQPCGDHSVKIATLACGIREVVATYAQEMGLELDIRIGIARGPLIGGVVGRNKFLYDVWGETVNLASRMETHGIVGRIQMTEAAKNGLDTSFDVEERGVVAIKGVGEVKTFFLNSGPTPTVKDLSGPHQPGATR